MKRLMVAVKYPESRYVILEQLKIVRKTHLLCRGPVLLRNSKPVFISGASEHLFY